MTGASGPSDASVAGWATRATLAGLPKDPNPGLPGCCCSLSLARSRALSLSLSVSLCVSLCVCVCVCADRPLAGPRACARCVRTVVAGRPSSSHRSTRRARAGACTASPGLAVFAQHAQAFARAEHAQEEGQESEAQERTQDHRAGRTRSSPGRQVSVQRLRADGRSLPCSLGEAVPAGWRARRRQRGSARGIESSQRGQRSAQAATGRRHTRL